MVSLAIPHSESRLRLVPFRKPPPDFTSPSADSETTRSAVVVSTKRRLMVANDCTMLPPTLNGPTAALVTSMLNLSMAPITTYWTPSNLPTFAAVVGSTALVAIEGMAWLGCAGGPGAVPLGPARARPGSRARLGIHARPVLARAARRSRPARARQAVRRRQPVGRRRRALAHHRARSRVRPRREGARFLPAQRFLLGQDDALPRRRRARDLADADVHPLADRAPGGAAAPAARPARPSRSDRRPANGIRGRHSLRRRSHGPRPLALLSFHVDPALSQSCVLPEPIRKGSCDPLRI